MGETNLCECVWLLVSIPPPPTHPPLIIKQQMMDVRRIHILKYKRKKKDRKKCLTSKIFVSMNKTKQSVFIQVASFHCKLNCTVLILLGFVDIMSFYFQPD